jgi:hypothetical protein
MAGFELSRSTHVAASPERVHALLNDFHQWRQWSPWEDVDQDLQRTYSGPEKGVGSRYEWKGNRKAGEGSMQIVESDPSGVVVDLRFLKPFKATNITRFTLAPAAGGTEVTWTMTGQRGTVMSLMGKVLFDRAIGKDFDKGLARLKTAAEAGA